MSAVAASAARKHFCTLLLQSMNLFRAGRHSHRLCCLNCLTSRSCLSLKKVLQTPAQHNQWMREVCSHQPWPWLPAGMAPQVKANCCSHNMCGAIAPKAYCSNACSKNKILKYLIIDFTSGENESMPISSCEDDKYEPTLSCSSNNVQHSVKKITKTTCSTVLPIHPLCAERSTYF